jgi:hypothetical protein
MKKSKCFLLAFWGMFLIAGNLLANQNMFAIYLPAESVGSYGELKKDVQHVKLRSTPILSIPDIISYSRKNHEIKITSNAYNRLIAMKKCTPFIVCLGRKRLYAGAFFMGIESWPFNGVVICTLCPSFKTHPKIDYNAIQLQLGYPTAEYFKGNDPRPNPSLFQVLEKAGKLKN